MALESSASEDFRKAERRDVLIGAIQNFARQNIRSAMTMWLYELQEDHAADPLTAKGLGETVDILSKVDLKQGALLIEWLMKERFHGGQQPNEDNKTLQRALIPKAQEIAGLLPDDDVFLKATKEAILEKIDTARRPLPTFGKDGNTPKAG
jgi:hypothetical protein